MGREGFFSFEGRRYALPSRSRCPEVAWSWSWESGRGRCSLQTGKLLARYERGRPTRVAEDPAQDMVALAEVLGALTDEFGEVHRRPLTFDEEVIIGG